MCALPISRRQPGLGRRTDAAVNSPIRGEATGSTAYLAAEDRLDEAKAELGDVSETHGRLLLAPGPARPCAWAQNIWFDPVRIRIASIGEGVKALRESRFAYEPPKPGFARSLALAWINRGRIGRIGGAIALNGKMEHAPTGHILVKGGGDMYMMSRSEFERLYIPALDPAPEDDDIEGDAANEIGRAHV